MEGQRFLGKAPCSLSERVYSLLTEDKRERLVYRSVSSVSFYSNAMCYSLGLNRIGVVYVVNTPPFCTELFRANRSVLSY